MRDVKEKCVEELKEDFKVTRRRKVNQKGKFAKDAFFTKEAKDVWFWIIGILTGVGAVA